MLRGRSYGGPHAQAAGIVYCWEFQADGAAFTIEPPGGIAVNDRLSMVEFAQRGAGVAYTADFVTA